MQNQDRRRTITLELHFFCGQVGPGPRVFGCNFLSIGFEAASSLSRYDRSGRRIRVSGLCPREERFLQRGPRKRPREGPERTLPEECPEAPGKAPGKAQGRTIRRSGGLTSIKGFEQRRATTHTIHVLISEDIRRDRGARGHTACLRRVGRLMML